MTNDLSADSRPETTPKRRRGFAATFAATRYPMLVITCWTVGAYWATLLQGFAVDDYRNLRQWRRHDAGEIDSPRLYEFLRGGDDNRAQRRDGLVPWWAGDDFRFVYFRPVTQAFMTAEHRLFGDWARGFHIVSVLLLLAGVRMALSLYRQWTGVEAWSRWAALCFAVAGCNAIPVAFIAAQCDLVAMVLCLSAALLATRYVRRGDAVGTLAGICTVVVHGAAIMSKEVAIAGAALPAFYMLATWQRVTPEARRDMLRRCVMIVMILTSMSLALVAYYGRERYGSNGLMLLDPIHHPVEYLLRFPGRVLLLLGGWFLPINPQWADLFEFMRPLGWFLMAAGAIGLVLFGRFLRRIGDYGPTFAFAAWAAIFMPLLVCTNPDNRVLMLPTIGLSLLAARWLCRPSAGAAAGESPPRMALALFMFVPFASACANVGGLGNFEHTAVRNLRSTVDTISPPPTRSDHVFFLNSYWQFDLLWCQDRCDYLYSQSAINGNPRVSFLSHMRRVSPEVRDAHTLRLRAESEPFFSTFPGMLAQPRGVDLTRIGQTYDAGEFVATICEVRDGRVMAVDFRFAQPLRSERYRFFLMQVNDPPKRWDVPPG